MSWLFTWDKKICRNQWEDNDRQKILLQQNKAIMKKKFSIKNQTLLKLRHQLIILKISSSKMYKCARKRMMHSYVESDTLWLKLFCFSSHKNSKETYLGVVPPKDITPSLAKYVYTYLAGTGNPQFGNTWFKACIFCYTVTNEEQWGAWWGVE